MARSASVRTGVGSTICVVTAGVVPPRSRADAKTCGRIPSATRRDMPSASRMLSSGGFVTCAKRWEKKRATLASRLVSALTANPNPIADTSSPPESSIGSMK